MQNDEWNNLVKAHAPPFGVFLQMKEWGDVQEALGATVKRVYEKTPSGTVLAQGVWQPLPLGASYWLFPKGPLGDASQKDTIHVLRKNFIGSAFFKIESSWYMPKSFLVTERHPAHTAIVSLEHESSTLYANMKPKTRYNVRLAQKKGVQIEYAGGEALQRFMRLMKQTADRDGFFAHSDDRYRAIVEKFQGEHCKAFFAFATYNGKDLAANLMIDAYQTRTYLHGASANENREVMAPYALHTELMEDAIEKKMTLYDFWGIAPKDAGENHPWAGITRFKMGFGGERVDMPGTCDIPLHPLAYALYRIAKKIK